jgi:hypothetical protein
VELELERDEKFASASPPCGPEGLPACATKGASAVPKVIRVVSAEALKKEFFMMNHSNQFLLHVDPAQTGRSLFIYDDQLNSIKFRILSRGLP